MFQILPPNHSPVPDAAPQPPSPAVDQSPAKGSLFSLSPSLLALVAGSALAFVVAPWTVAAALVTTVWGALLLVDRFGDAPVDMQAASRDQANANWTIPETGASFLSTFTPPAVDPFHEEKMARRNERPLGPIELPETNTPLRLVREELFGKEPAAPLPATEAPLQPHPISLSAILLPDQSALTQATDHQAAYRGKRVQEWKAFAATSA